MILDRNKIRTREEAYAEIKKILESNKSLGELERLWMFVQETLPYEVRQDALFRHAIASRQYAQLIGIAVTHHPDLTPDARPMHGLEDSAADVLVQTMYFLSAAGIKDIDKVCQIAFDRMMNREWEKKVTTKIDGHTTGQLSTPWIPGDVPLEGTFYEMTSKELEDRRYPDPKMIGDYILVIDHLDNDHVMDFDIMRQRGGLLAVVVRHGGITSHAAIVCRERRIPCVVGVGAEFKVLHPRGKMISDPQTGRAFIKFV